MLYIRSIVKHYKSSEIIILLDGINSSSRYTQDGTKWLCCNLYAAEPTLLKSRLKKDPSNRKSCFTFPSMENDPKRLALLIKNVRRKKIWSSHKKQQLASFILILNLFEVWRSSPFINQRTEKEAIIEKKCHFLWRPHVCTHTCLSPHDCAPIHLCPDTFVPKHICDHTRLCPHTCAHTRLCPHMFVPTHVCAHTHLCPYTFVPRLVCAHTRLCPEMFVPSHVCALTCYNRVVTIMSGHKCVWAQTYVYVCSRTRLCPDT